MNFKSVISFSLLVFSFSLANAQLHPGFDAIEFKEMLSVSSRQFDSLLAGEKTPAPAHSHMQYRAPVTGLDNRWELWLSDDGKTAVISIRGTVNSQASWLANVYAAMQPATGSIRINDSTNFQYKLAENPRAAVHTGWLIALASMSASIEANIKDLYEKGIKDFIIFGHSQGGAISYLLSSHLYYLREKGALPKDIRFKTYSSAAPKPGNLYYVNDYDFLTRGGWGLTVLNAADWVPENPFSIQQVTDFNPVSPFTNFKPVLQKQKFLVRLYGGIVYNKLAGSSRRAVRRYEKVLGKQVGKSVKKLLPGLRVNDYAHTLNYMRAGIPIILMPDGAYYEEFPDDVNKKDGIWNHHTFHAYYSLTDKWYGPDAK